MKTFVWLFHVFLLWGCAVLESVTAASPASRSFVGLLRPEEPPVEGNVEVVRYRAGYTRARTAADLSDLFRDNLDADMAPFKRGAPWPITAFEEFVRGFNDAVPRHEQGEGNAALVVIINGTVRVSWLRGQDNHWRMGCVKTAIQTARALKFPDTAFILNIDDFPVCANNSCKLPVMTNYKKWDKAKGNVETNEVLVPVFNHHYEDMYIFPWEKKRDKAFMRASQQGCMEVNSSRVLLAITSEDQPSSLDLGITRIDGQQKQQLKFKFSRAGFVSIEDHAKWKYLVSADGCVAQTRLPKVMLSNSVVVKEESLWIEYYYRSLKPWTHYVPFSPGPGAGAEVLDLVRRLRADDRRAQRIAETAQKWAYKHLSQYPRLLYMHRVVVEYNKLFGGQMERWVQSGGPDRLLNRRHTRRTRATLTRV